MRSMIVFQTLRLDIQLLKDQNSDLNNKVEEDKINLQQLERKLADEHQTAISRERKLKAKVNELELSVDMERARQLEITKWDLIVHCLLLSVCCSFFLSVWPVVP